jgi:membrane-bound metal-dependent hydrolase YbcI (DUF457 family)
MVAPYINPDDEGRTNLQNSLYLNFDAADHRQRYHSFFIITMWTYLIFYVTIDIIIEST